MIKTKVMDFVQSKGTATRQEIITFILGLKGRTYDPISDRGYYSCALCPTGYPDGYLVRPSKKEPRSLSKIRRGIYEVKTVE